MFHIHAMTTWTGHHECRATKAAKGATKAWKMGA